MPPVGLRATASAAILGGLLVFVLLFLFAGNDSAPPECFAVLGCVVPCGFGSAQESGADFAALGGVLAGCLVLAGALAHRADRNRRRSSTDV